MSIETMKRQSSTFSTLVLNSPMSKLRSFKTLMAPSTWTVKAAFLRISRETARKMSSISTQLWYLVESVGSENDAALK